MTYIPAQLRRLVEQRANYCCEYCQVTADFSFFPHEVDHVIPEKHGGLTQADNLAYSCWRCNRYKGSDLGSFDPKTGQFSFLFNPRTQSRAFSFSKMRSLYSKKIIKFSGQILSNFYQISWKY
ncbi:MULTISPECIES: HNH endonuclease [Planktothrix]|uniref:HNH endonuclease n=1 Tax=Planktothrix TaxID=54304 RepID=UPI0004197FE1|nr:MULTISPECIES: HNH endonuclease signature motif containing protein [Planktothrix]